MILLQVPTVIETLLGQLNEMVKILPNLALAVGIFLFGWIFASLVARVLKRVLKRVGVDKLAKRLEDIDIVQRSGIKLMPSVLLAKIVYYLLIFIFLITATEFLGMKAISDLMTSIMNYLPKLFSALLVFLLGIFVADFLKNIILTACKSLGIPAADLIANIVFYFILLNVVMITLSQADLKTDFMEMNISIILGGVIFAFAIGYGFASRGMMANLLASYYNRDRIRMGDDISISGVRGTVVDMDAHTFTLQTEESKIIMPLSKLSSEAIEIFAKTPPAGPTR
jgi:hypothetical protein